MKELSELTDRELMYALLIAKERQGIAIRELEESKEIDRIYAEMKARREKERVKNLY